MLTSSTSVDPNYLTRRELAKFLTERGFPISKSTLDKLAMPSRGEGRLMRAFGAIALSTIPTNRWHGRENASAQIGVRRPRDRRSRSQ
jgi:hypothetical protein